MNDTEFKKCKSKKCHNHALKGKYCEHCKKIKKEKKIKFFAWASGGGTAIISIGAAIKNGALKQVPTHAAKALKLIFKV